jgi:hypothetical protein
LGVFERLRRQARAHLFIVRPWPWREADHPDRFLSIIGNFGVTAPSQAPGIVRAMEVSTTDLVTVFRSSRERLDGLARTTALRHTGLSRDAHAGAALGAAAREAVFADALLAAIRARIAEMRTAAK